MAEVETTRLFAPGRDVAYFGWLGDDNFGDWLVYAAAKKLFGERLVHVERSAAARLVPRFWKSAVRGAMLGGGTLLYKPRFPSLVDSTIGNATMPFWTLGAGVVDPSFWETRVSDWKSNVRRWNQLLKRFSTIGVRGPRSQEHLERLSGIRAPVSGDLAFALAGTVSDGASVGASDRVVVNVALPATPMHASHQEAFRFLVSVTRRILRDGWSLSLLPLSSQDVQASMRLRSLLEGKHVDILAVPADLESFGKAVANAHALLGMRLHFCAAAAVIGLPSVMIEYRPKGLDLMLSLGQEEYCLQLGACSVDDVMGRLIMSISKRAALTKAIRLSVGGYATKLKEMTRSVLSQIDVS